MKLLKSKFLTLSIVAMAAFALIAAACGGDDDDDIQTGSEEDYVKAACEAQNEFTEAVFAAALELGEDASDDDIIDALKDPVKDLRDAMKDARPPEDLVEYHRALIAAADDMVDAIEDGDQDALDNLDSADDELSQEEVDRLNAIAADTPGVARGSSPSRTSRFECTEEGGHWPPSSAFRATPLLQSQSTWLWICCVCADSTNDIWGNGRIHSG